MITLEERLENVLDNVGDDESRAIQMIMAEALMNAATDAYGLINCIKAYRSNEEGNGASTIAEELGLMTISQADACINAGRYIKEML